MILTFAQIKDVTGLAAIVSESRKVTPFLTEAQFELRKMLGRTLYDELDTAIAASFAGEADLQTLFEDYVKRPLAWRTLQHALPRLYSEPTANGVHLVGNAEYTPVDKSVLAMQVNQAKSYADAGYDEMLRYLRDNTTLFPSYETEVDNEERVKKTYRAGVVTKKTRWQYPYGLKTYGPYDHNRRNLNEECCDE
jgi:hypothetical protein